MYRYPVISRVQVWFLAGLLCLLMATAVLSISSSSTHTRIAESATSTPTPTQAPNGWTDPIGG